MPDTILTATEPAAAPAPAAPAAAPAPAAAAPAAAAPAPAEPSAAPAAAPAPAPADPAKTEPAVPESYEFKMPEGIELDKAAATEFSAIAKELKLDQPTAQKVADVAAKMIQRQAEVYAEQVAGWGESVRTDKEFGGDKLDENLGLAKKAVEKFGSPELQKLLDSPDKGGFGLGNHPEVVRLFYRIGKAISEDGFVRGGATVTDAAAAMYPSMTPKT